MYIITWLLFVTLYENKLYSNIKIILSNLYVILYLFPQEK